MNFKSSPCPRYTLKQKTSPGRPIHIRLACPFPPASLLKQNNFPLNVSAYAVVGGVVKTHTPGQYYPYNLVLPLPTQPAGLRILRPFSPSLALSVLSCSYSSSGGYRCVRQSACAHPPHFRNINRPHSPTHARPQCCRTFSERRWEGNTHRGCYTFLPSPI